VVREAIMWKVIEEITHNKRKQFKVVCDCGRIEIRRKDHVLSHRTIECKSCSAKRTVSTHPMYHKETGLGLISGTLWTHIRAGARRRGIEFKITPEYAWDLFEKQNRLCALSGVPILLSRKNRNNGPDYSKITASLDRIHPGYGYINGNVQWVHKTMNYVKRDLLNREFINWCKLVGDNNRSFISKDAGGYMWIVNH
jgi:hypothetical protein